MESGGQAKHGVGAIPPNLLKLLGAVATAIGTTGAVGLVGAAVLWVRFNEAGVPAIQAVTVQPQHEALVEGAQDTIVFVLIALTLVLLMYFADRGPEFGCQTKALLITLLLGALVYPFTTGLRCQVVPILLLIALSLLLFAGCWAVGKDTSLEFWALAASVFVASLIFSSACGLLIVKEQKFVQPVAVLRGGDDAGLTGVYVAATDKTIYLAQPVPISTGGKKNEKMAIFEVPREGATYSVGPLESRTDAELRAEEMLERLRANRSKESALAPAPAPSSSGATGPTGATGVGGATGATGSAAPAGAGTASSGNQRLEAALKAFEPGATLHQKVEGDPLCLVRYTSAEAPIPNGEWWTSCGEAKRLKTVQDVRESLALPGRFQPVYDMRIETKVPADAELIYLEGTATAQREHLSSQFCGHSYEGGGKQYYLFDPSQVTIESRECTSARQSALSRWGDCGQG